MTCPLLILASRSPRRALLLRRAGYEFEQMDPPFDDPPHPPSADEDASNPAALAMDLACRKALSLRSAGLAPRDRAYVILAADTICVDQSGRLIGQAADRACARRILAGFVNAVHRVISAVAMLNAEMPRPQAFADEAAVTWGDVTDRQIEAYLSTNHWRGKAGAYNLTDRQADGWPISVRGDPDTVVGLPMTALAPHLARFGVISHPSKAPQPDRHP